MSSIGKPTTLGKIERWYRTYDVERPRFKRHEQYIKYYYNKRVHMSLNYMTPVQVYNRSVTHVVVLYKYKRRKNLNNKLLFLRPFIPNDIYILL
jgi:hypothetical protein